MNQVLRSVKETVDMIAEGKILLIAGDEKLLAELPKGGLVTQEQLFVSDISDVAASVTLKKYDQNELGNVYLDAGEGGFSFIIIPASSPAHVSFALNAPNYQDFGSQPL
ncbi:hypothetical protein ADUPG1_001460, partial [Aduncisulcus paluster]